MFDLYKVLTVNEWKNALNSGYIETILDGQDRVLEKNVYLYDDKGRIKEIKYYDMLRRGREGKSEIPIRVSTYEYD